MLNSTGSKLAVICVIAVVIILVGVGIQTDVFSILNKDTSQNINSIGEILVNPQKYVGQKITVPGYYFQGDRPTGEGFISSEFVQQPIVEGSLDNVDLMLVNISTIKMSINESTLYDFTGIVLSQSYTGGYPTQSIILSVEKVTIA